MPFGLGPGPVIVAEEALQPDDWLVLRTDGVTEARDEHGDWFGQAHLVDFLEREAAADRPPPETVRRLVRAVLRHQKGVAGRRHRAARALDETRPRDPVNIGIRGSATAVR
ncbi:MAG: SpoIIE family protein phosphatase [Umezawaea sp.]